MSTLAISNGSALSGESFEDSPTESDPMGGNMGLETPYIEPEPPPEPTEESPFFEVNDLDPQYVNGQRVTMTLQGLTLIGPVASALFR
ncbi:MAG: hypothetical protein ACRD6X_21705, partial [Pyrinomonadaceae bacterium]